MRFSSLNSITAGRIIQLFQDREIGALVIDSRKVPVADDTLFFAIKGSRHDGHGFITDLYKTGVRQFVIDQQIDSREFPTANFLLVDSTVQALHAIVHNHRASFHLPVIGITGSNGKTIIKEWLFQLLSPDQSVVKNPGSYNSQVGVPLAVWQIRSYHTLGIFEAGISLPDEMTKLRELIEPTIGILTNIGPAHDEGFISQFQKIDEKLNFFENVNCLVYCVEHTAIHEAIQKRYPSKTLTWGNSRQAAIRIHHQGLSSLEVTYAGNTFIVMVPFHDAASIENVSHCIAVMLYMGYNAATIQKRVPQLKSIAMRLELKQGLNHCQIVDDTYNNDLAGLQISLDFLAGLQHKKKVLILSDILQSGLDQADLSRRIGEYVVKAGVNKLIGIGPNLTAYRKEFERLLPAVFFESTELFLSGIDLTQFQNEAILIKGARPFQFEKIIQRLQKKAHGTVMEVDLGAMVDNLNYVKSILNPGVKLMVMVKAFAYGSGSEEVASLLQYHKVDYLGVAYADEGVELRKNQIVLPIMVMNPSEDTFGILLEHHLEPEIYSLSLLRALVTYLQGRRINIHLKLDTGMHRLGFEKKEMREALELLSANPGIHISTVFSHLSGADESIHDDFTNKQADLFVSMSEEIERALPNRPVRHLLNSSGILRFPNLQFDMVRLGIGLYGVDPTQNSGSKLRPAATLKTIVSQVKHIGKGETIGYGRKGRAERDSVIATIAIGYADGFSRAFSGGKGEVLVRGRLAPVVGNVCMDMTMIDVTGIGVQEGDEVIIFGKGLAIQDVASRINTIPYEILTNTSERVKRVFYAESI